MKLKKVMKILPGYERIRVWGNDENVPLYDGEVWSLPHNLCEYKLISGEEDSYFEIRHDCTDIGSHVAIFVEEK